MRYTIYNLKKKGKNSFFFLLIVILVATIILSTSMFNLWGEKVSKFIMGNSEKQLNIIEEKNQNFSDLSARFLIMQMGAYNSKEGAIQQCDTLKSVINSFVIEDDSKFKIFTGIYDEENFSEIEEKIVSNGIDAFKITYEITIDEDIIKKLKIGLASSERNYLNLALKQKNHSELDQIELGLIKNDDTNTSYDVFRNRIIFPIENNNGQVVGFSGRIYRDNNQAKYINSSDNEIFHKGKILYHFHDAIPAIRENNKIIIFEGFMDVIAAIRANIHYGVATMGTALTNDHIKAILSLTKNIILCFDGDEAGIHAMKRSAMLFANYQIIPKAIVLPNNQDPDEYVKENGIDKLNQYFVANEKNVYAYLYDLAFKKFIKGDLESAENFKKEVFEFARFSKTNTIVEHFIKMLAEDLEVSFDSLMKDFGKMDYIHSSNEALPLEKTEIQTKIKPIKIKKKVFLAYNMLIKHMIFSKRKFIEFKNQIGDELYLDKKLAIHFEFVKKMEIFYAENEKMDEEDFMEISKKLDEANNSLAYSTFAREILEKVISNIKDDNEFMQCLDTINDCKKDLSGTRFYNKAISSRNIEDIKNFETIRKEHVKIMSKEEK